MWADFRLLANDRAVDMVDDAAIRADELGGTGEELIGRRAFPLRVRRREMLA